MTDLELLEQLGPFVVYDSRESYRADAVAVLTDLRVVTAGSGYCSRLRKASGEIVAVGDPKLYTTPYPELTSDFLAGAGNNEYLGGIAIEKSDSIVPGSTNYPADALRMHANPDYADRVYGRVVESGGKRWLQYWFFYYFNDMLLDRHEGDWEMIQIGLNEKDEPINATYSQHDHGESRDWGQVPRRKTETGEASIVYPALGSHANYYDAGWHHSGVFDGFDRHDGGTGEPVRPTVIQITDNTPGWISWPGSWGSTSGMIANSPRGPEQQTGKWTRPDVFWSEGLDPIPLTLIAETTPGTTPHIDVLHKPPLPEVTASQSAGQVNVAYQFTQKAPDLDSAPVAMRLTLDLNPPGPPLTYTCPVRSAQGQSHFPTIEDQPPTDLRVTVIARNGSESVIPEPIRLQ